MRPEVEHVKIGCGRLVSESRGFQGNAPTGTFVSSAALNREAVIDLIERSQPEIVAIDSPRCSAREGETTRDGERQIARTICGIRWTPDAEYVRARTYCAWIVEGLGLFDALAARNVSLPSGRDEAYRRPAASAAATPMVTVGGRSARADRPTTLQRRCP